MSADLPSYEQAAATVAEHARRISQTFRPSTQRLSLSAASGRILAAALHADDDQPPFARSTRDGFACRAHEASAHAVLSVAGSTHAGEPPAGPLPPAAAWEIMTGAPVPPGADCVVMLEHVEKSGDAIQLLAPRTIAIGENVVAQGAQSRRGDELLAAGVLLGPAQLALAASCGNADLEVFSRPRVAILTTGDELVPVDSTPGPGKIRNSNAPMLASLVNRAGGDPLIIPAAADTAESLDAALAQACSADMLLISGGVSAGKFDLVEPALARLGAKFHFTGVKIQPGKPLVFAQIPHPPGGQHSSSPAPELGQKGTKHQGTISVVPHEDENDQRASAPARTSIPVLGLPGNPISSAATFLLFAAPILAALSGSRGTQPRFVLAQLLRDTDRKARPGLTRFLPALCVFDPSVNQPPFVAAIPWHGSGDLTAFAQSNCFLVVPEETSHLEAGSTVLILLH